MIFYMENYCFFCNFSDRKRLLISRWCLTEIKNVNCIVFLIQVYQNTISVNRVLYISAHSIYQTQNVDKIVLNYICRKVLCPFPVAYYAVISA